MQQHVYAIINMCSTEKFCKPPLWYFQVNMGMKWNWKQDFIITACIYISPKAVQENIANY